MKSEDNLSWTDREMHLTWSFLQGFVCSSSCSLSGNFMASESHFLFSLQITFSAKLVRLSTHFPRFFNFKTCVQDIYISLQYFILLIFKLDIYTFKIKSVKRVQHAQLTRFQEEGSIWVRDMTIGRMTKIVGRESCDRQLSNSSAENPVYPWNNIWA